jgi:peptidoglycan/LPS O-acetylase OafA/YrhL
MSRDRTCRRGTLAGVSAPARNAPLDAVRGLAAASVFVFHTSNRVGETYGTPYRVLGHLDVGVRVFFILSGYFIYKPFVRAHLARGRGVALGEYVWKRFWRIYPAYWLALAFAWAVGYVEIIGSEGVWKHGLLVWRYFEPGHTGGEGMRESWTLVVEVTLYVLIPVFALGVRLLGRLLGRARAELGAVLALLVMGIVWLGPYVRAEGAFAGAGLGRVLEPALLATAAGMLLAVVDTIELTPAVRDRIVRLATPTGRWWIAAGVVFVALVTWLADDFTTPSNRTVIESDWYNYQWGHALIATLLVAPLVLAPGAGGALRSFLSQRWVVLLGVVSFSFYLWHIRVLTLFLHRGWLDRGWVTIGAAAVAFAGAFAAGWLGQRYVEQPCGRLASRWPLLPVRASRSTRRSRTARGAGPGT